MKRISVWTVLWLLWICAFLGIEIPAALNKTTGDTLSENMWNWFSVGQRKRWWKIRLVVLGVFWVLGVGVAHFMFRASALWTVILPGIPFAAVIVYAVVFESDSQVGSSMFKSIWKGLKGGGGWILRHGPIFSSAVMGLSFAVPALKPVAVALGALMGGGGAADPELAKSVGELVVGLVAIVGVVRKIAALTAGK